MVREGCTFLRGPRKALNGQQLRPIKTSINPSQRVLSYSNHGCQMRTRHRAHAHQPQALIGLTSASLTRSGEYESPDASSVTSQPTCSCTRTVQMASLACASPVYLYVYRHPRQIPAANHVGWDVHSMSTHTPTESSRTLNPYCSRRSSRQATYIPHPPRPTLQKSCTPMMPSAVWRLGSYGISGVIPPSRTPPVHLRRPQPFCSSRAQLDCIDCVNVRLRRD